MSKRLLVQVDT